MKTYVVTGGAGFIGSAIVRGLLREGADRVTVIDNLITGREENLDEVRSSIEFHRADVRCYDEIAPLVAGADVIFHEAAIPSVPRSISDPVPSHECNIDGTFQVLRAAAECGVRRVVYAASSSAYGDTEALPKVETMCPRPKSPYAVQKLVGEYYASVFASCFGLETVSLRYFNVFGPRQDPKSQYAAAIPAFVTAILKNEPPTIYGDGEQTRDFTYIDNVVHANLLAASAPRTSGEVVNIACGESVTVNQIIALINRLLGRDVKANYVPARAGDVKHSLADISLARQVIGYQPVVSFEDGLRRAIDWYKANPNCAA